MLHGKTIAVTGAASGIGAATAAELARQGARVIGIDRNRAEGPFVAFHQADLGTAAAIDALAAALPDGLHGLCNIAGLPPTAPAGAVLGVNLVGLKRLTLALVPRMADGAAIVNLASLAATAWARNAAEVAAANALERPEEAARWCAAHGIDGTRAYFLSKEALVVWTMQNRWSWRDRGIRMNAVSPGPVETPILQDFLVKMGDRPALAPGLMDRMGRPEDIAPLAAFLCADASAWIRGANIPCDGGMAAHAALGAAGMG